MEKIQWKDATMEKPNNGDRVLVWLINSCYVAKYNSIGNYYGVDLLNRDYKDIDVKPSGITHWMPMPGAPQKQ